MERMLVVVFDNEKKAFEGKSALTKLELEGSIGIFAGAVVVKHADGTVSTKNIDDFGPVGSLTGTALGSLIGLLGGPAGVAVGAISGLGLGALYDIDTARIGGDFLDEVSANLTPNKVAVIADVEEDWTTPVDTRMEALGGTVFRRALWEVRETADDRESAAMKADLVQFKSEIKQAKAERHAKLQKKIDALEAKIDARQKRAEERHEAFKARQNAKLAILKKNAAAAGHAVKELANTPV
jgi:uncharacterized membrane protein